MLLQDTPFLAARELATLAVLPPIHGIAQGRHGGEIDAMIELKVFVFSPGTTIGGKKEIKTRKQNNWPLARSKTTSATRARRRDGWWLKVIAFRESATESLSKKARVFSAVSARRAGERDVGQEQATTGEGPALEAVQNTSYTTYFNFTARYTI